MERRRLIVFGICGRRRRRGCRYRFCVQTIDYWLPVSVQRLVSVCHLNSHHPARRLGADTLAVLFIALTLFRAGGGAFRPPSGFSCAIAEHRNIERSYLVPFSRHSLRTFWHAKIPGQVRSGHQRRFVDPASERFAITPELKIFTDRFSLQVFIRVPPCTICISQNLYICDLRSGQICDLYIISLLGKY